MESYSRFSTAVPVESTAVYEAILGFENTCISQFWAPAAIKGDLAFIFEEFQSLLAQYDIVFRSVPRQRHQRNLLERKHGVIRYIIVGRRPLSNC